MNLNHRPNFFFEPPIENASGTGTEGGAPASGNAPATVEPPPNPFANIDKDLLDDRTRAAVEKAEGQLATLANQAKQSSTFQSEVDRLKGELATTQEQVRQAADPNRQRQQQQQQQQQQQPPTFEQEILDTYIASGLEPKVAASLAKMNAGLFEKHSERLIQQVDARYQPVVANTLERNTVDAFQNAQQNDPLGILQNPDIAQRVWERADEMSKRGQLVDEKVLTNLARIYYVDYLEANGGAPSSANGNELHLQSSTTVPNMVSSPSPARSNMNTRHTYPGAGNQPRIPINSPRRNGPPPMNSDERAAMEATTASWPVKPKEFRNNK